MRLAFTINRGSAVTFVFAERDLVKGWAKNGIAVLTPIGNCSGGNQQSFSKGWDEFCIPGLDLFERCCLEGKTSTFVVKEAPDL